MAGDWIKMRTTLANDPAVISIACALDIGEFEVVGMLHHLWSWADAQSRNGHAAGVTKKWVDRYVHRDGFADAMCSVGWLVIDESGLTIPNFERHNGKPAKDRALAGERQRIKRANVTQNVTDMSRDERDSSVTREEKRREDKDQDQKPLSSAVQIDADAIPKKPKREKPPLTHIVKIYNEVCGSIIPRAVKLDAKRTRNIEKCWNEKHNGVAIFDSSAFWQFYFQTCMTNAHWRGEDGKWCADIEFLTRETTVTKVFEMIGPEKLDEIATKIQQSEASR